MLGVAVAVLLRFLAPGRMVMVYVGFGLTDTAIQLQGLPRWGATATVVHHGLTLGHTVLVGVVFLMAQGWSLRRLTRT